MTNYLLWSNVTKGSPDECWPWTGRRMGGRDGDTYGALCRSRQEARADGAPRQVYAHRLAYSVSHNIPIAQIPRTTVIRHKCDNPVCCNPNHLEMGTQAENVQDKIERGRHLRGEAVGTAKLTEVDVRRIKARLAAGEKHDDIAADYGVERATITVINTGRTWAWVL